MKTVVAASIFNDKQEMLLCRKKTLDYYIFPGGKSNPGESDIKCLQREIFEELRCEIASTFHLQNFKNESPKGDAIFVKMYDVILEGNPVCSAEIVELYWYKPGYDLNYPLTPTSQEVLAYLTKSGAFNALPPILPFRTKES